MNTRIFPGRPWLDTEGKRIHAHGGSILFEDGAWIRAKRGEFKGVTDILIKFYSCTNVTIRGGGNPRNCGFRMWRDDYDDKSQYKHSEWRHTIAIYGCVNVTLDSRTTGAAESVPAESAIHETIKKFFPICQMLL